MNHHKKLDKVLVPKERVIGRGQGCWNCKHWDRDKAKPLWQEKRQNDLNTALALALDLPNGEPQSAKECTTPEALRCFNIKSMVNSLDHLVASGHVGVCTVADRATTTTKEDGKWVTKPVGDFTVHSVLCDKDWSGVQGASLATGGKTDPLPGELAEKLNKPKN